MKKPDPRIPGLRTYVSAATVRRLLDYSRRTGELRWLVDKGPAKAGDDAGTILPNGNIVLTINGRTYTAARIIWLWVTGAFPPGKLTFKDRDPGNLRWNNIMLQADTVKATSAAATQRLHYRRRKALALYGDDPQTLTEELKRAAEQRDYRDPRDPRNTLIYQPPKRRKHYRDWRLDPQEPNP